MTEMTPLYRLSCVLTRSDQALARRSNDSDRATTHALAVTLVFAFVLASVAWYTFFSTYLTRLQAIALGGFCGALVFLFDQAMVASDWTLSGVLSSGRPPLDYWIKLTARVAVALVLAQATAVGVTMAAFEKAIGARLQQNRVATNAPVLAEYKKAQADFAARTLDPLTSRLRQIDQDRTRAIAADDEARAMRSKARQQAANARIEAGREMTGGLEGYIAGEGPRYQEARRQEEEASLAEAAMGTESEAASAALSRVEAERRDLLRELTEAEARTRERAAELDRAMEADPRYVPARTDPLLQSMALAEIMQDPVTGPATRDSARLWNLLLVTFELMPLLIKVVFSPASVYTVRLITRTRAEAASVATEYGRQLDEIRKGNPRRNLKVVGGTEVEPRTEDEEEPR